MLNVPNQIYINVVKRKKTISHGTTTSNLVSSYGHKSHSIYKPQGFSNHSKHFKDSILRFLKTKEKKRKLKTQDPRLFSKQTTTKKGIRKEII